MYYLGGCQKFRTLKNQNAGNSELKINEGERCTKSNLMRIAIVVNLS